MGALVTMREEPTGASIPKILEPDEYHNKRACEAELELARLRALTAAQIKSEHKAEYIKSTLYKKNALAENKAQIRAYKTMLAKVREWLPPTASHDEFKNFMIDQLQKSIDFDDLSDNLKQEPMGDSYDWLAGKIAKTKRDVEYHQKGHIEEVTRTTERNAWLDALRGSLKA